MGTVKSCTNNTNCDPKMTATLEVHMAAYSVNYTLKCMRLPTFSVTLEVHMASLHFQLHLKCTWFPTFSVTLEVHMAAYSVNYTLKRIKYANQKIELKGLYNKIMTLIFIYNVKYITWLPFMLSFLRVVYVRFVTSHVASFYNEVMAFSAQF